jgi:transcriptional regulator with XRE-family HTH domain
MALSIGQRIRYARKKAGLTQNELAERVGTDPQTISRYELGKISKPPSKFLENLSKISSVDLSWLIAGEDDTPKPHKSAEEIRQEGLYSSDFDDLPEGLKSLYYNEERFNALQIREEEAQYLRSPEVTNMVGTTGGTASEDAFVFMLERLRSGDINFMKLDKTEETLVNLYRDLDKEGKIAAEKYLSFLSAEAKRKKRSNPDSINKLNERF